MKTSWVKLQTGYIKDEKLHFLVNKYGHECNTFWTCLLSECDNGVLELEEEIFIDTVMIENNKYMEIKGLFIKYGLIKIRGDYKITLCDWEKYNCVEVSYDKE